MAARIMARVYFSFMRVPRHTSTGPAGVDEPNPHAVLLHLLRKHFRIICGRQWHKRRAETSREGRLWLCYPNFRSCHFRGVPGKEVVHRLSRVKSADRRQHTERIARQKEDVLGMGARPVCGRARNVRDRVRTRVFCVMEASK